MKEHLSQWPAAAKDVGIHGSMTDVTENDQIVQYVVALYSVASILLCNTAVLLASRLL